MFRLCLSLVLGVALVACNSSEAPFATYKGEPNADDAAIQGQLLIEHGRCLYVVTSDGRRHFVALPAVATTWDADTATLQLSGVALTSGDTTVFGGSGLAHPLSSLKWKTPPPDDCDTSNVWVAGDSARSPFR